METFRQRQLNHQLKKIGFGGLDDPSLIHQMAFCVRDHEHFRKVLVVIEPEKRKIAYEAMSPHLRFKAWPLDRYIIAAQQEAEELQTPVMMQDGKIVDYKDYHGERPSLEVMAEKAIHGDYQQKTFQGSLALACSSCLRNKKFPAPDRIAGYALAKKSGWIFVEREVKGEKKEFAICPRCAKKRHA